MMLTAIDININLYFCQKHVMILTTIDTKILTIYDPQTHKICVKVWENDISNCICYHIVICIISNNLYKLSISCTTNT